MGDRGVTLVLTAVQQDMAPFSEIISSCARAPGNRWDQRSVAGHTKTQGSYCRAAHWGGDLPAHHEDSDSKGVNKIDFFILFWSLQVW